ncbi:MAG: peptide-methionine (S)-S-oxide reductase MsrA [Cyclobacteriaceae bacterium]|nr:peptide-methionine (S)-S-oxide reductase MsrA [Cyclobacteriaceae bacterium]MCH8517215.1 peptide-methionine (S)-S-oxide reductase MsrA [Cyclobacteriaceae bacterium]
MEKVTLGAGCFWCIEAIYLNLKGVESVLSGYMGGSVKNPTYRQVVTGNTGHAEVVELTFDPSIISFGEILEVFFETHDPTTLNRQGNDVGTQYRSAIFYYNDEQKRIAEDIIKKLDASGAFNNKIVTEVTKASEFYEAEDYHQNYYELNKSQPYCTYVIKPKMDKFKKVFSDKLKE